LAPDSDWKTGLGRFHIQGKSYSISRTGGAKRIEIDPVTD
jgi:hypothetical protein